MIYIYNIIRILLQMDFIVPYYPYSLVPCSCLPYSFVVIEAFPCSYWVASFLGQA